MEARNRVVVPAHIGCRNPRFLKSLKIRALVFLHYERRAGTFYVLKLDQNWPNF
jgi:hypothetical protein